MKVKYKGSNNSNDFIVTENGFYFVKDTEWGWGGLGDFGWYEVTDKAKEVLQRLWDE